LTGRADVENAVLGGGPRGVEAVSVHAIAAHEDLSRDEVAMGHLVQDPSGFVRTVEFAAIGDEISEEQSATIGIQSR
jgi:hypothetical protein